MGSMRATLLAKSRDDFDAIKKEVEHNYAKYNEEIVPTGWKFVPFGRPYDQETASNTFQKSSSVLDRSTSTGVPPGITADEVSRNA